jgi:hypothetical protein
VRHHRHEAAAGLVDVEAVHARRANADHETVGSDCGIGQVDERGRLAFGRQGNGFHEFLASGSIVAWATIFDSS